MRVVIASNFYPPFVAGGAELLAAHLARWLASEGHAVTVISTCDEETGRSEKFEDGVSVIRYFPQNLWWNFDRFKANDRRSKRARLVWNVRDMWNIKSGREFGKILDNVRPDVVHTHNIKGMSPSIWRETRRRHIRLIHTTHDYSLICQGGTMTGCVRRCLGCVAHGRWHSGLSRLVDRVCSPSRFVKDRLGQFGVTDIRVVRNGVPGVPTLRPERSGSPLRLLFIGQLRHEKGAHLLPDIARSLDRDAHIDIAGTGPLMANLKEAAINDPRLVLHGFLGDAAKRELLDRADALLFPSVWSENAPLVISEAFMRGLPVIGSNFGAIPEFIEHDHNGLLCAVGDASAFAAAAKRLVGEAGLHTRLAINATRTAADYSVSAMGRRYLELYAGART